MFFYFFIIRLVSYANGFDRSREKKGRFSCFRYRDQVILIHSFWKKAVHIWLFEHVGVLRHFSRFALWITAKRPTSSFLYPLLLRLWLVLVLREWIEVNAWWDKVHFLTIIISLSFMGCLVFHMLVFPFVGGTRVLFAGNRRDMLLSSGIRIRTVRFVWGTFFFKSGNSWMTMARLMVRRKNLSFFTIVIHELLL